MARWIVKISPYKIHLLSPSIISSPLPPTLSENDDAVGGGSPSSSHTPKRHFRLSPLWWPLETKSSDGTGNWGCTHFTQMHTEIKLPVQMWIHGCTQTHTRTHTQSPGVWCRFSVRFSVIAEGPLVPSAQQARRALTFLRRFMFWGYLPLCKCSGLLK